MTVPIPGGAPDPALAVRVAALLVEREGRKPVLVAGVPAAPVALAVALDHPSAVGGVMIVDDVGGGSPVRRRLNSLAARLGLPVGDAGLGALETKLSGLRAPVTLLQGNAPTGILGVLENGLTGCRTLTVVAVPGTGAVRPRTHAAELRAALAALVAAVERVG